MKFAADSFMGFLHQEEEKQQNGLFCVPIICIC